MMLKMLAIATLSILASSSYAQLLPSTQPAGPAPDGMVWIAAGTFRMGSNHAPDVRPIHEVSLDGFWMDKTTVTNGQFARFVEATHYVTVAERKPDPKHFPGVPADTLV